MEVDLPQFSDQDGDDDFWAEINDDNTQTGASELETGGMHGEGSPWVEMSYLRFLLEKL